MANREPRERGPRLAANPEDVAGYRKAKQPRREGGAPGRPIGYALVLAMLVAGLAVAGWFIFTQQRSLQGAEKALAGAEHRIQQLEARLMATDETMSATGDEFQDKFKFWESEIRKLWDVANKRNVEMIKSTEAKLDKQTADLAALQTSINTLTSSVKQHAEALGQQDAVADQLAATELQVRNLVEQQRELTSQLAATRQSVSRLENDFARRLQENEKAIDAIDAYRLQVNSRLAELNARIQALSPPPGP